MSKRGLVLATLAAWALLPAAAEATVIVQGTGDTYVAFEAEDFARLTGYSSGWTVVDTAHSYTSPQGNPVLPGGTNASGGQALLDAFGDPWGSDHESTVTYRAVFQTAGDYRMYIRQSLFDSASSPGSYGNEDSYFRPPTPNGFGAAATATEHSGGPDHEGTYGWRNTDDSYTVAAGDVGKVLTFELDDRERGYSFDRVVFSTNTGLSDAQLDALGNSSTVDLAWRRDVVASEDAYVRRGQPNANFGSATSLLVKHAGDTSSTTRKSWIKFALGGLDPALVRDAALSLDVTVANTGGGSPVDTDWRANLFGLDEDVDHTWTEGSITWNNAPGNDPNDGGGDATTQNAGILLADATFLGQVYVPGPGALVTFWNSQSATPDALLDFIQADTDGILSFALTRVELSGNGNLGFASIDYAGRFPPTLSLYMVPEPGTLGLLALGGAAAAVRRRRKAC